MPTKREFFTSERSTIPGHTTRRPSAQVIEDALVYACVEWGFDINRPVIRMAAAQIAQANGALYSSQGVASAQGREAVKAQGIWLAKVSEALSAVGPFLKTPACKVVLDGRTLGIARRIRITGDNHKELLF